MTKLRTKITDNARDSEQLPGIASADEADRLREFIFTCDRCGRACHHTGKHVGTGQDLCWTCMLRPAPIPVPGKLPKVTIFSVRKESGGDD